MKRIVLVLLIAGLLLGGCRPDSSSTQADSGTAIYIENKGSDTMVNLALAWAEAYQQETPGVRISVTGGGSGTGIAALLNQTVDLANASRAIKAEEIEQAHSQGLDPREFVVARDAIAVIVNPENPVQQLTLPQIAAIYKGEITNWSQVGGEDRPIVCLSRETNSGTHVYFLETVIRLGSSDDDSIFAASTLLMPSSEGIIAEVSDNPNAIGYDGLGYITDTVKVIGVAPAAGEAYIYPSVATVNNGQYPVARDLYMYTGQAQPAAEVQAYLDWIFSAEAQQIVADLGFVPVVHK